MMRTASALILVGLALGACGRQGPLFLPGANPPEAVPAPTEEPQEEKETETDEQPGAAPS